MTVRLEHVFILIHSVTSEPFLPYHSVSEAWLKNYMEENPFPESTQVSSDDIFTDFMGIMSGLIYYHELTSDQKKWIETCCNAMH